LIVGRARVTFVAQLHLAGVHADPQPDRRAVALDIGEKQRHRSGWQKLTQHQ
jgi:hypothetical protein